MSGRQAFWLISGVAVALMTVGWVVIPAVTGEFTAFNRFWAMWTALGYLLNLPFFLRAKWHGHGLHDCTSHRSVR